MFEAEAKASRPMPNLWGRAEFEAKILASRPLWPRGHFGLEDITSVVDGVSGRSGSPQYGQFQHSGDHQRRFDGSSRLPVSQRRTYRVVLGALAHYKLHALPQVSQHPTSPLCRSVTVSELNRVPEFTGQKRTGQTTLHAVSAVDCGGVEWETGERILARFEGHRTPLVQWKTWSR